MKGRRRNYSVGQIRRGARFPEGGGAAGKTVISEPQQRWGPRALMSSTQTKQKGEVNGGGSMGGGRGGGRGEGAGGGFPENLTLEEGPNKAASAAQRALRTSSGARR